MGKADGTKEALLEAALDGFSSRGLDGCSTREITGAARANLAAIRYHFGGKELLYEAALVEGYDRLVSFTPPALPEGADAEQRVTLLVGALFRHARQLRRETRLLLRHVLEHGSLPTHVRDRANVQLWAALRELTQAAQLPDLASDPMALLSLNHLIARYAISLDQDISAFSGNAAAEDAVAAHLGRVACALLLR